MTPIDADAFYPYLEQVLLRPGDTLILDNLSTHKISNVHRLLSACGARVRYLPPYSPDLDNRTGLCQTQSSSSQSGPHS